MLELLIAGLRITAIGMGLVFLLLAMMWALLVLLLKFDREQPAHGGGTPEGEEGTAPELAAAITVAVITHQAVRRKQAAPAMRTHWPGTLPSRWVGVGRSRQARSWTPDRR